MGLDGDAYLTDGMGTRKSGRNRGAVNLTKHVLVRLAWRLLSRDRSGNDGSATSLICVCRHEGRVTVVLRTGP